MPWGNGSRMRGFAVVFHGDGLCQGRHFTSDSFKVEKGAPSVAIGIYVNVLRVLRLVEDLGMIAK